MFIGTFRGVLKFLRIFLPKRQSTLSIFVFLTFLGVAQFVQMTWPLGLNFTSSSLANVQSDVGLEAGFIEVAVHDRVNPLFENYLVSAGGLDGLKFSRSTFWASPIPTTLEYIMGHAVSGPTTLNIFCLAQIVLGTLVLGFGVLSLTKSRGAAVISAMTFTFLQPTFASLTEIPTRSPVWLYALVLILGLRFLFLDSDEKRTRFPLAVTILMGMFW